MFAIFARRVFFFFFVIALEREREKESRIELQLSASDSLKQVCNQHCGVILSIARNATSSFRKAAFFGCAENKGTSTTERKITNKT